MTATLSPAADLIERAAACAAAALPLLPAPEALSLGNPTAQLAPGPIGGQAVSARLTGALQGEIAVVVTQDLVDALRSSPLGELDVVQAVQPALEAAAAALGPVILEPGRLLDPSLALEGLREKGSAVYVPLVADGRMGAMLALAVAAGGPRPVVPAQREPHHTGLDLLRDVEMEVTAELGRTRMTVRELLSLAPGAVVELDRAAGSPADLLVNGRLIARGEVVVVDEDFGIRITEILGPAADATG